MIAMNDQASSLRKLKQMVDEQSAIAESATRRQQTDQPEDFLKSVIRPSPFCAIALIVNDLIATPCPPAISWLPSLMGNSATACLWDQAQLIEETLIPKTQIKLQFPTPVRIDSGLAPLIILPRQPDINKQIKLPVRERISFLEHIERVLKKHTQLWISIKASELAKYQTILHATDAACVMVPNHSDSILKSYEAVKNIHLSGYFSPIGLLDFACDKPMMPEAASKKIKIVAKQFLAIDLVASGMVLSNCTFIPPEDESGLNHRISSIDETSRDFLYCLSESMIYPIPGIY